MTPYELRLERDSRERWQRALIEAHKEPVRQARTALDPPIYRTPMPEKKPPADWIASLPHARTVSSRTIAGLAGKRHTDVLRDTRKLTAFLEEGIGTQGAMAGVTEVIDNRGFAVECRLSRAMAVALMAGYSPVARYQVGQRLQELEAGAGKASKVIAKEATKQTPIGAGMTPLAKQDGQSELSMTSLEIAKLTGKEHFNVMRDIREMLGDLAPSNLNWPTQTSTYTDSQGKSRPMYALNKNLTLTLLTGYSATARYRVICRWQELEEQARQGDATTPEIAKALANLQTEVAALKAKEAERAAIGREYAPISAMRHKYGYPFSWESLKEASLQHGLRIRTMPNGKCGYHRLAWLEAYGIEL